MDDAERGANATLTVDLEAQEIRGPDGGVIRFDIDPFRKQCLLEGLDDIGLTLQKEAAIESFETSCRRRASLGLSPSRGDPDCEFVTRVLRSDALEPHQRRRARAGRAARAHLGRLRLALEALSIGERDRARRVRRPPRGVVSRPARGGAAAADPGKSGDRRDPGAQNSGAELRRLDGALKPAARRRRERSRTTSRACWRSAISPRPIRRAGWWRMSACTWRAARRSACSAPMARARPRCST